MSSSDKKKLQQLQAKWYRKLERSGFKDVEAPDAFGDMRLKQLDSNQLRHGYKSSVQMVNVQRYYELARQFHYQHNFENGREKRLWELHAEGLSAYHISEKLKSDGYRKNVSMTSIKRTVKKLERVMLAQRVGALDD